MPWLPVRATGFACIPSGYTQFIIITDLKTLHYHYNHRCARYHLLKLYHLYSLN
jgi:hypothetical protein